MLNDAINQIREDVLKGKSLEVAVKSAAEDFELNPVLVARKFAEKFGSVEKVLACAAHASPTKSLDDLALETAQKWAGQFIGTPKAFGKRFKIGRTQYVYVANKGGVRPVIAIDVERVQAVELPVHMAKDAWKQVGLM